MPDRPRPPDSLSNYLAEGLPKQDDATLRDVREYVDALLEWRSRPVGADDLPDGAEPVGDSEGTVVEERVTCGDETCRCASGREEDLHGPYRYRYRRIDGKLTKEYLGKA